MTDTDRPTLNLTRRATTAGRHPFDDIQFERRSALIPGPTPDAPPSFQQDDVSVPATWSQNCTNIVAQKFFAGLQDTEDREWSVKQMIGRVVETASAKGAMVQTDNAIQIPYFVTDDEREVFEHELARLLVTQQGAFNSPVWFNVGVRSAANAKKGSGKHPRDNSAFAVPQQVSACFILSVEDSMDSIVQDWGAVESIIFKNGSGSGLNISAIRASMETLSAGGRASGPVTFMRGPDAQAGTITSGGRTRRAAKMVVLDIDHPDIQDFIWCKVFEERKAHALEAAGFDMSLNTTEGERNRASIQYQNANNSVRLTDDFMRAAENDEEWRFIARTTGEPIGAPVQARDLLRQIAEAAWECADPGVQFDTTINEWHTTPETARINASNPCSEYMSVDNSSCNLASLNLMKFRNEDGTFDVHAFTHAVRVFITAMDILISFADYPVEDTIGETTRRMRQLGLGYANLGAYLMSIGVPYDSDKGRAIAAAITALMSATAYDQSAVIAARMGPYAEYDKNAEAHLGVIRKHQRESNALPKIDGDQDLVTAAKRMWKTALDNGLKYGYRNAQATVLAPTGTISFLMDCDTTGVEPDFSLVKFKELVGGGNMVIVNETIPQALGHLGYAAHQVQEITSYIRENNTIIDAPHVAHAHYPVFATAVGENTISPAGHINMMAAVQPYLSGAISKTVNLPSDTTPDAIADVILSSWHKKIKALTVYRDGSKTGQPLNTSAKNEATTEDEAFLHSVLGDGLRRGEKRPLSKNPPSRAHQVSIGGFDVLINVHEFDDGAPARVQVDLAQTGSPVAGMMRTWAITLSEALRYGVPLSDLVDKLSLASFEPLGITDNPEIRNAKSVPAYAMSWLARQYTPDEVEGMTTYPVLGEDPTEPVDQIDVVALPAAPAPSGHGERPFVDGVGFCNECGGILRQTGSCTTCTRCGANSGCG